MDPRCQDPSSVAQGSVLGLQGKSLCKAGQVQIQVGPGYETCPRDRLSTGPTDTDSSGAWLSDTS